MNSENFKASNPDSVLSFFQNLKTFRNSNGIHEGAVMWAFQYSMKDPAKAALSLRVCATMEDDLQQEGKLTTYSPVVNCLLATYATDDEIIEIEANITNLKQPEEMSAVRSLDALLEKALRYGRVYEESRLIRVFIKRSQESIRFQW